jgi:peptide/nickel transport system permease protein
VRAEVLSISEKDFIEGAKSVGASDLRIMFKHLLPSVRSPIIIISTFNFAWFIIAEASLSFLGLGVPPSIPTWGAMMADSRAFLNIAWWFPTFPGLALVGCVLGANLLGDGLRDRWDPRMRS